MTLSAEENTKPNFYKTLFAQTTVVYGGSSSATASSVTFATVYNAHKYANLLVWCCPPLRIESKGLVKYKYHIISKGIQLNRVHMLVTSDYCSIIRTKALCCQDDDV